ncbi:MAG: hypothetical protein BGP05_20215 [Rhizobiales bacterium 62-47]|nr:MAG: hypothetical protein BGP05_20215 [Rhizobiales bacterium 62-47]
MSGTKRTRRFLPLAALLHTSRLLAFGVDIVPFRKGSRTPEPDITLRIHAHLFRKDGSKAAAAINAAFNG